MVYAYRTTRALHNLLISRLHKKKKKCPMTSPINLHFFFFESGRVASSNSVSASTLWNASYTIIEILTTPWNRAPNLIPFSGFHVVGYAWLSVKPHAARTTGDRRGFFRLPTTLTTSVGLRDFRNKFQTHRIRKN